MAGHDCNGYAQRTRVSAVESRFEVTPPRGQQLQSIDFVHSTRQLTTTVTVGAALD